MTTEFTNAADATRRDGSPLTEGLGAGTEARNLTPNDDGMLPPDPKCKHCRGTGCEEIAADGEGGFGGTAYYDCTCRFRGRWVLAA